MIDVSFVIPTRFGGLTLLRCLETVTRERARSGARTEVVLVADGADDQSLEGVEDAAPGLRLIRHETARGVAAAYNRGFEEASGEFAALLNDDMFLEPGYLEAALAAFTDDRVFAAATHVVESGTHLPCCGRNAMGWDAGRLAIRTHRDHASPYAFYATGGAVVRRAAYLDLGGFSDLYAPFYWEDVHVSYQAWARGYEIRYAPEARVVHHHRATVNRIVDSAGVTHLMRRNAWLFGWANLTSPALTSRLIMGGLGVVVRGLRGENRDEAAAFRAAHARLPRALQIRARTIRDRRVADEEIWEKVGEL